MRYIELEELKTLFDDDVDAVDTYFEDWNEYRRWILVHGWWKKIQTSNFAFLLLGDFDDEGHFELFMLKTSRVNYSCIELLLILFLFLF